MGLKNENLFQGLVAHFERIFENLVSLSKELDTECQVDTLLDEQEVTVCKISETPALSISDILLKLDVWEKSTSAYNEAELATDAKLVKSVASDLREILRQAA